ncbi:hypothetical protein [Ekhidna sp.]
MSTQEYYHVFESIIYAAIVTQLLSGWYRMFSNWDSIRLYWAHSAFTIITFILVVDRYFRFQSMEHFNGVVNTATFILYIVLAPAVFYILTLLLFPTKMKGNDLKVFMLKRLRPCMIATTIYGLDITIRNLLISEHSWTFEIPSFINISIGIILIIKPNQKLFEFQMAANILIASIMIWNTI